MDFWQIDIDQEGTQGFPKWRDMPPYLLIFFENPSIKVEAHPHDPLPQFKNEAPLPIEKKKKIRNCH